LLGITGDVLLGLFVLIGAGLLLLFGTLIWIGWLGFTIVLLLSFVLISVLPGFSSIGFSLDGFGWASPLGFLGFKI